MTILFWLLVVLVFYIYAGYGLLIMGLARILPNWKIPEENGHKLSATLLIAAHNEAPNIGRKIENALSQDLGPHELDILVVSDGSDDDTVNEARKFSDRGVRVIEIKEHVGKVVAINQAIESLSCDIVIFSDADSFIGKGAVLKLLRHFADENVGGACGRIEMPNRKRGWIGDGEALYWEYDHALREAESRLAGAVTAQGSLYAIRRILLQPLVPAVADDLLTSLRVVTQGKRLVFDTEATVQISVTGSPKREFSRRVRMTERGFRGLLMTAELINPLKYGFYSLQLFSHKWLRRFGPFFILAILAINIPLIGSHPIYSLIALGEAFFFGFAAIGWWAAGRGMPWLSLVFFFVLGNCAMGLGVINTLRGKRTEKWKPVR